MKKFTSLKFTIILIFSFGLTCHMSSQMPQRGGNMVRITGWTDDTHYLIQTFDAQKNPVIKSVDIKTGKEVVIPPKKSEREILSEALE